MNDSSCLNLNEELWRYRHDVTTLWPTMIVFGILYAIIILCGVIGNICVILAITRNKTLQTVPNLFILSLSCSDIVVCCISATITPITAFKKEWIFGAALCRIAPFIAGISLCFSTFTLTAISVDRYMLIRFPMKKPISRNQALLVIGMICVFAACISSPIMFKQKLDVYENFCALYCTEDWTGKDEQRKLYGAALLTVQLVLPLTIIIISYTAIALKIGQSMILKGAKQQTIDNWEAQLTDQQRMAIKRKQRTNRMLIAMVVAFSLSWIWSVSFNVLRDYDYLPEYIRYQEYLYGIATHCVAMTSTVWNPLLYAALNLQLRAAFAELVPQCLRSVLGMKNVDGRLLKNGTAEETRLPKYGATLIGQAKSKKSIQRGTSIGDVAVPLSVASHDVVRPLSIVSRASSRASRDSRKPSMIRVLVQSKRDSDEENLIGTSPSNSLASLEMSPNVLSPRRKSTCVRVQHVASNEGMATLIVRTSSF